MKEEERKRRIMINRNGTNRDVGKYMGLMSSGFPTKLGSNQTSHLE